MLLLLLCVVQRCLKAVELCFEVLQLIPQLGIVSICF